MSKCVFFLTSKIYPIKLVEAMESTGAPKNVPTYQFTEAIDVTGLVLSGVIDDVLLRYLDGEPEAIDTYGLVLSGAFGGGLVSYEDGEAEAIDTYGTVLGGSIEDVLVRYSMVEEAIDTYGLVLSGEFG